MALTKIGTDGFKDDAVTTDKLANAINTERTANTAKTSTTINNNADNRVITGSGTANTLNGESSLTYDGSDLNVSNDVPQLLLTDTNSNSSIGRVRGNAGNLILSADTNTATAGSIINFEIDGSERLRVDSSGRVGIGTTSPAKPLDIYKSGTNQSDMYVRNATVNYKVQTMSDQAQAGTETNHPFYVVSNNQYVARFDGDGIKFGSDTAAANALDDYEEGTWTPTLLSGTSLTFSSGRYVKIGAMVYAFWEISMPSTSSSSHMIINNTPFTSINHNASCGGTARDYQQYDIQDGPIYHVPKANTQIQFYKNSGQNFVESNGTTKNFRGCSIYQTA